MSFINLIISVKNFRTLIILKLCYNLQSTIKLQNLKNLTGMTTHHTHHNIIKTRKKNRTKSNMVRLHVQSMVMDLNYIYDAILQSDEFGSAPAWLVGAPPSNFGARIRAKSFVSTITVLAHVELRPA